MATENDLKHLKKKQIKGSHEHGDTQHGESLKQINFQLVSFAANLLTNDVLALDAGIGGKPTNAPIGFHFSDRRQLQLREASTVNVDCADQSSERISGQWC
jgi:hypothetical protein